VKNFTQWWLFLIISVGLITASANVSADDSYGISIEQRALDILTLTSARMSEMLEATDIEQVVSVKAKLMVADVFQSGDFADFFPTMMFQVQMELFKAYPGMVRANLTSSLGDLQFVVTGNEAMAILPDMGVFARVSVPQFLPATLMFPNDNNGLFTLLNLLGGIPYGSIFNIAGEGGDGSETPDVGFVDELDPSERYAVIRYRGKDVTEGGVVHVISIISMVSNQYIKVMILEDTLELYQISIEDQRGTETFVVLDEVNMDPVLPDETFVLDTSGLVEVGEEEFRAMMLMKLLESIAVEEPIAADLYASSHEVAQTGMIYIHSDGFDIQEMEHELICEIEYMPPGGSWTSLKVTEYAGLPPLGHWNAVFVPDETSELGKYSFRTRYTDIAGNASEWLEASDIVTVMPAPPRVVRTSPIIGERDVSVSTDVSIAFSKPMNRATVEQGFVMNSISGRVVSGSFRWEENTLIFSPSADLEYETTYLARVNGESLDTEGLGLDGNFDARSDGIPYDDYVWSFRTSTAVPTLTFEPIKQTIYKGDKFDVKVMAKYVTDMHKFSFKVLFDPAILEVEAVERSSFKSWKPRSKSVQEADLWIEPMIDNAAGSVKLECNSTRSGGVSGVGYIAAISFRAIGVGEKSIGFGEALVEDYSGQSIDAELDIVQIPVMDFHPKDVNHDGVVDILDFVESAPEESAVSLAASAIDRPMLKQNFPNPFNPETWIPYQLAQSSPVIIRIYRTTGELIRTLDLGHREPGFYFDKAKAAYWDGTDDTGQRVSSGVYFYNIQTGGYTATKKMLLCK